MKVEFINPFLNSMTNVLVTMAMMKLGTGKAALKAEKLPPGDVTGLINMSSPKTTGTLAISFSEPVILDVAQRMLQEEFSEINDDITDLVGEITNMVAGGAKAQLQEKGYDFDMARPVVVKGRESKLAHKENAPVIIVPFSTDEGEFFVEVCFD